MWHFIQTDDECKNVTQQLILLHELKRKSNIIKLQIKNEITKDIWAIKRLS